MPGGFFSRCSAGARGLRVTGFHDAEEPAASGGRSGAPDAAGLWRSLLVLRPGERLLAGQQAEEGDGLHRAGQGGLVDVAVQRNLGGAEGSAVEMGDEGIAFEDEAVLFRSEKALPPRLPSSRAGLANR